MTQSKAESPTERTEEPPPERIWISPRREEEGWFDTDFLADGVEYVLANSVSSDSQQPTHRCNGVNGAERHGTSNKCTVCGEYREGYYDSNGMEVLQRVQPKSIVLK